MYHVSISDEGPTLQNVRPHFLYRQYTNFLYFNLHTQLAEMFIFAILTLFLKIFTPHKYTESIVRNIDVHLAKLIGRNLIFYSKLFTTTERRLCPIVLLQNYINIHIELKFTLLPPPARYVFTSVCLFVCLSVCLSVCRWDISKSIGPIFMSVYGSFGHSQGPIH